MRVTTSTLVNGYQASISNELRDELQHALSSIDYSPMQHTELFLEASYDVFRKLLPSEIFSKVRSLKNNINSSGYLLLRNFPVDKELIDTPNMNTYSSKSTFISESCITGVSQILGEIFGYKNEKEGKLIHNIIPKRGKASSISNEGFGSLLDLHNEDIHVHPYSPTFVSLFCLRKDHEGNAKTFVLPVKSILNLISDSLMKTLRKPLFFVEPPESFGDSVDSSGLLPVISGSKSNPQIIVEFNDMNGISEKARQALFDLKQICYRSNALIEVKLVPGDLLIFDNRKVIHGRSTFQPYFDGKDRWCQRVFVKSGDFWAWRELFHKPRILLF